MTAAAILIAVLAALFATYAGAAFWGGWRKFQALHPDQLCTASSQITELSLHLGKRGYYGQIIRVQLSENGIRISAFPLIRLFYPAIFIPWTDVLECEATRFHIFEYAVRLQIARWPHPIHIYSFFWKHHGLPALLVQNWKEARRNCG